MSRVTRTDTSAWPCTIARSADVLGDSWNLLIIRQACLGIRRFDDFQRSLAIGRNILTTRLNRLVDEGLLSRVEYQQRPVRHEYRLTPKGRDVYPILAAMAAWGDRWLTGPEGTPLVLHHTTCDHDTHAVVVCSECAAPLDVREILARPGPGAPSTVTTGASETALVVLVPEAEPVVAEHRLRHDPAAADGVPAHVTVLYPFRTPVDDATAASVAAIAVAVAAFDVTFRATARFPGVVLYLDPEPAAPFHELIARCTAAFPDCPPYGGTIPDPLPHLTVADGVDEPTADDLDADGPPGLPITSRVDRLTLIAGPPWTIVRHFPLA